jgi:hypothetical protein
MADDLQKLFSLNKMVTPPAELLGKIITKINIEKQARFKRMLVLRSLFFIFSVILLIWGGQWFIADIAESGFSHFLTLLFSDGKILLAYWQTFIMVLLESLPVSSLLVILAAILAILQSLKFLTRDLKLLISNHYLYGTK